jgi:hypothetical protein
VERLLNKYSVDAEADDGGGGRDGNGDSGNAAFAKLLGNYRTAMALEYSFFDANGEQAGLQGDPAALEVSAYASQMIQHSQLP